MYSLGVVGLLGERIEAFLLFEMVPRDLDVVLEGDRAAVDLQEVISEAAPLQELGDELALLRQREAGRGPNHPH